MTFHSPASKPRRPRWQWLLRTRGFPKPYGVKTQGRVACLLGTPSCPQVHRKEPAALFHLPARVERIRTELGGGGWNRHVCPHQGSRHRFETARPPKDTTYNTNNAHPPSNDATVSFPSTRRPGSLFPESSKPVFSLLFNGEEMPPEVQRAKVPAFGVPCPGHCSPRRTPGLRPTWSHALLWTVDPAGPPRPCPSAVIP